jgi:hypothetical protein
MASLRMAPGPLVLFERLAAITMDASQVWTVIFVVRLTSPVTKAAGEPTADGGHSFWRSETKAEVRTHYSRGNQYILSSFFSQSAHINLHGK